MRIIVIDVTARTVEERQIEHAESLRVFQEIVGGSICFATDLGHGDTLYVDDEGLFKYDRYFDIGAHQPFAGNGVIAGSDSQGETRSAKISLDEVRRRVRFGR